MSKYYDLETEINDIDNAKSSVLEHEKRVVTILVNYLNFKGYPNSKIKSYEINENQVLVKFSDGIELINKSFGLFDIDDYIATKL